MNEEYIQQRRNRKKQFLRIRLGILQMIHKPLLNVLFIPIIAGAILLWMRKDIIYSLFKIPRALYPIYYYLIMFMTILLSIICILAVTDTIGNLTARKDEADLHNAFNKQELRNGCPILMNKRQIKGSAVMIREFYSNIPMKTWLERQEDIADALNVHFVEQICYGGKSNGKRIVMYTAKGRKQTKRGVLYDDEL